MNLKGRPDSERETADTATVATSAAVQAKVTAGPDSHFWAQRFANADTPWDRGGPGPHLAFWLTEGRITAGQTIAVPGCGTGHEVLALAQAGCRVTGLDYTPAAIALTQQRLHDAGLANNASVTLVQADVLQWQPTAPLDAIYEQTCWCALHPDHWRAWAAQLHRWLRPGGRLLMMVMQAQRPQGAQGFIEGPPYHVDMHAVRALLPATQWRWPTPPYPAVPHTRGWFELAIELERLP